MVQTTLPGASQPSGSTLTPPPVSKKNRSKSSAIWQYAADVDIDGITPYSQKPGKKHVRVYRCRLCTAKGNKNIKEYETAGGTNHFRAHLQKHHNVAVPTLSDIAVDKHTAEAANITNTELWNSNIRASSKRERSTTASSVNAVELRALFLNWLATNNILFKMVESHAFRAFLQYVNHHTNNLLPLSVTTV